jgi:hypothetical protein
MFYPLFAGCLQCAAPLVPIMASVLPRAPATAPGQGIQALNAKPQVQHQDQGLHIASIQMGLLASCPRLLQHALLCLFSTITCINFGPSFSQAPTHSGPHNNNTYKAQITV